MYFPTRPCSQHGTYMCITPTDCINSGPILIVINIEAVPRSGDKLCELLWHWLFTMRGGSKLLYAKKKPQDVNILNVSKTLILGLP